MRSAGASKRRNTFIDGCHRTLAVVASVSGTAVCASATFDAIAPITSNAKTPVRFRRDMEPTPMSRSGDDVESRGLSLQSRPMWKVLVALLVLGVGAAALWVNAGQAEGPAIAIGGPEAIGQTGEVAVKVTAPGGELTGLAVKLVQGESATPLFDLSPETMASVATLGDEATLSIPAGKRVLPN